MKTKSAFDISLGLMHDQKISPDSQWISLKEHKDTVDLILYANECLLEANDKLETQIDSANIILDIVISKCQDKYNVANCEVCKTCCEEYAMREVLK